MGEAIQLGPMLIRTDLLILIASVAVAYGVLTWTVKSTPYARLTDHWASGILIVIASWKLGPIVYDPGSLWRAPLLVLLMPGTRSGMWIGIALALAYIAYRLRREKLSYLASSDWLALPATVGILLYHALTISYGLPTGMPWGITAEAPQIRYHPVNAYTALLLLPVVWRLWRSRSLIGTGQLVEISLIGFGFARMLSTFFAVPSSVTAGLTSEQWSCIGLMLAGIFLRIYRERNEQQRSLNLKIG
jgi:hypothetical protein